MNKGLEAIKNRLINDGWLNEDKTGVYEKEFADIEKELKKGEKIKERLTVVNMKLISKRKECSENMNHTDEEDFVHEASKIEMDCLDWFRKLIEEVLS